MIISTVKIAASPENRKEILEILFSVKGPSEGATGCISCFIYQDLENEQAITYEEVWQSKKDLDTHLRSDLYRNILAAMDMSSKPPEVRFNTVSTTEGMELVKEARGYIDLEEIDKDKRVSGPKWTGHRP